MAKEERKDRMADNSLDELLKPFSRSSIIAGTLFAHFFDSLAYLQKRISPTWTPPPGQSAITTTEDMLEFLKLMIANRPPCLRDDDTIFYVEPEFIENWAPIFRGSMSHASHSKIDADLLARMTIGLSNLRSINCFSIMIPLVEELRGCREEETAIKMNVFDSTERFHLADKDNIKLCGSISEIKKRNRDILRVMVHVNIINPEEHAGPASFISYKGNSTFFNISNPKRTKYLNNYETIIELWVAKHLIPE